MNNIRMFFRRRPTGRVLVLLVVIKLFVMFAILRVFFFRPAMAGMDEAEKAAAVGTAVAGSSER